MLRRHPIPGAYVAAALAVAARCGALPDSADWKDIQAQPCNLGLQDKYGRVSREKARVEGEQCLALTASLPSLSGTAHGRLRRAVSSMRRQASTSQASPAAASFVGSATRSISFARSRRSCAPPSTTASSATTAFAMVRSQRPAPVGLSSCRIPFTSSGCLLSSSLLCMYSPLLLHSVPFVHARVRSRRTAHATMHAFCERTLYHGTLSRTSCTERACLPVQGAICGADCGAAIRTGNHHGALIHTRAVY